MYTEVELNDEFGPVDADECAEMRLASGLGYSMDSLAVHFGFEESTIRHHLDECCSHY